MPAEAVKRQEESWQSWRTGVHDVEAGVLEWKRFDLRELETVLRGPRIPNSRDFAPGFGRIEPLRSGKTRGWCYGPEYATHGKREEYTRAATKGR